ncbi:MAG: hypothetical protein ACT4PL_07515 [Phycisphaerales bacterium]
MPHPVHSFAFSLVAALAGMAATAQTLPAPPPDPGPPPQRHCVAARTVSVVDWEAHADRSRPDFDPDPVPRSWVRAQSDPAQGRQREGFPKGNEARYDDSTPPVAASGSCSIKLPVNGGSTSLYTRRPEGLIPVFAGADYSITAKVRTRDLRHARAFLVARYMDQGGEPIEGASRSSIPVRSESEFTDVGVELPGTYEKAAFIQIELQVLQPSQFAERPLAPRHHVWPEDLSGAAWFDDITITQLARVTLTPVQASHVALAPDVPRLSALVRDLTGQSMTVKLELRDLAGDLVESQEKDLPSGGGQFTWAPSVSRFGWYEGTMTVFAEGAPISRARTSLLYLPAIDRAARVRPSFPAVGIDADTLTPAAYDDLPGLVRALNVRAVTIPLWSDQAADPGEKTAGAPFRAMLDMLLRDQRSLTLSLARIERGLAAKLRIDASDPIGMFDRPETDWAPSLRPILDAYGQRITSWQIGSIDWPASLTGAPFDAKATLFRAALARLVPAPTLSIPWSAAWDAEGGVRPGAVDHLALVLPQALSPAECESWALSQAAMPQRPAVTITLPSVDVPSERSITTARAFQQAILLWSALNTPRRADLPVLRLQSPWTAEGGDLAPHPTLGLWRTLADHLAGRRVVTALPAPAGVRCFLLAEPRALDAGSAARVPSGAIVLWRETPDAQPIEGYFGLDPLSHIDAFGNSTPLTPLDASGRYRIEPTDTPAFIEGVSPELAVFSLGFKVTPDLVAAVASEHEHTLVINNPWPIQISGTVQLLQPSGNRATRQWTFSPASPLPFSIPAGASQRLPFSFSFGLAQDAGLTQLPLLVNLTADRAYPPMRIQTPITIALPDIELATRATRSPDTDGPDIVISATVKNTGRAVHSIELSAAAPGFPQQAQSISNLGPGQTAVRRFVFKGGAAALSGKRLHVTLTDAETVARLNSSPIAP